MYRAKNVEKYMDGIELIIPNVVGLLAYKLGSLRVRCTSYLDTRYVLGVAGTAILEFCVIEINIVTVFCSFM